MAVPGKCIVICGPTACGKTRIGVSLASRYGGEIISADSRQVYRSLDIGSGKDLDEYVVEGKTIPYHCIDIAEPSEVFTLYHYLAEFNRSCNAVIRKGSVPIIVGGTGLYIEAALKQYDVPHAPENQALREKLMALDRDELLSLLSKEKDLYDKTDLSSTKRIVRSLEIAADRASGVTHHSDREELLPFESLVIGIMYPREELHQRIYSRLMSRLQSGMIDEVERLIAFIPRERILMFGMEYSHIAEYLWGNCTYEEMVESLFQSIRHLAKRQMTWFRGMDRRGIPVHWIDRGDFDQIEALVEPFFRNK
ncbi:MAG TPA: tRNA (adenosine(37)-N6)-dimethylallyltransferase MiaA [Spirochaetota bacterium]